MVERHQFQQEISLQVEKRNGIQRVVRVYPFGMRSCEYVWKNIEVANTLDGLVNNLPLVAIYMGLKTGNSKPSRNMITPFGGKIEEDENIDRAAYRELDEEGTFTPIPGIHEISTADQGDREQSFDYSIIGYENVRRAFMRTIKVISPWAMKIYHPKPDESKILATVGFTIPEFEKACYSGRHTVKGTNTDLDGTTKRIVGSAAKISPWENERIDTENRLKRNAMIDQVIHTVKECEKEIGEKLRRKILLFLKLSGDTLRYTSGKEAKTLAELVWMLKKSLPESSAENMFKSAYKAVISDEYTREFRRLSKPLEEDQIQKAMEGDILKKEAVKFKQDFTGENLAVDFFHYLPLFATIIQRGGGYMLSGLIRPAGRFLQHLVESALKPISLGDFEQLYLQKGILVSEKHYTIEALNNKLIFQLSSLFDVPEEVIRNAWSHTMRFVPALIDDVMAADPQLNKLRQVHEGRNEITNASLAQVLLFVFGVSMHDQETEWPRVKFEALRQLLIFSKILFYEPLYQEIVKKQPNPISMAIESFFGRIVSSENIELQVQGKESGNSVTYLTPIERRFNDDHKIVTIVDSKPTKPLFSYIRKLFSAKPAEIKDIFSTNVVLPDREYGLLFKRERRISFMSDLENKFLGSLYKEFPSEKGWRVHIHDRKNTYDNYFSYFRGEHVKDGGKRTGSQAERIIRSKMIIEVTNKEGETYIHEIAFYPFEKLDKETDGKLLGWKEKIEDDMPYTLRRMLEQLSKEYKAISENGDERKFAMLGMKSLYELFFPPLLYELTNQIVRTKRSV